NIGSIKGGTDQSTVAEEALVRLDRRYVEGETLESVIQEYQDIADEMKREDPSFSNCNQPNTGKCFRLAASAPADRYG
ncbi:MAG: peptidase dimerization domain-containing protein, partial [Bacillota bacterium]|nr:peptidase dimerization domain-containing protein [Bacillota bacterium]